MSWELCLAALATSVNLYWAIADIGDGRYGRAVMSGVGFLCGVIWIVSLIGGAA